TNARTIENSKKNIKVPILNPWPNASASIPASPKLKKSIDMRITANPSHFPHKKEYIEIGYVERSPHCPSSFSIVTEKPPSKRVTNGNTYKVIFITVPVISVYPSADEIPDCSSKIASVKMVNRIKKAYVQEFLKPNF